MKFEDAPEFKDLFNNFNSLSRDMVYMKQGLNISISVWKEYKGNYCVKIWGREDGPQDRLKHLVGAYETYQDAMESLFRYVEFLECYKVEKK